MSNPMNHTDRLHLIRQIATQGNSAAQPTPTKNPPLRRRWALPYGIALGSGSRHPALPNPMFTTLRRY